MRMFQSPVFLLFLDCVWQLLQQFPSRLAFTETFLTTTWDTVALGITHTFLYNSMYHRHKLNAQLPSAWDWNFQLSDEDIILFKNPLYSLHSSVNLEEVVESAKGSLKRDQKLNTAESDDHLYHKSLSEYYTKGAKSGLFEKPNTDALLPVRSSSALLQVWSQCYLRWSVPAQILGGGRPALYLQQCLLVEEVLCLDHKLRLLQEQAKSVKEREEVETGGEGDNATKATLRVSTLSRVPRPQSGLVFSLVDKSPKSVSVKSPALDSVHLTSSFPFPAVVTAQSQHKLINGPLSLYLHDSLVHYDYADSED